MAQDKLPSAVDVARCLIHLAAEDPDYLHRGLTNLQLQKLLYYVQGWSLGRRDKPVFRDQIRAWQHGPVVKDVYAQYKAYDDKLIPLEDTEYSLPPLVKAFIASIWDDYKWYSAGELVEKTHHEQPWIAARGDRKSYEPSDELIPDAEIREFFAQPVASQLSQNDLLKSRRIHEVHRHRVGIRNDPRGTEQHLDRERQGLGIWSRRQGDGIRRERQELETPQSGGAHANQRHHSGWQGSACLHNQYLLPIRKALRESSLASQGTSRYLSYGRLGGVVQVATNLDPYDIDEVVGYVPPSVLADIDAGVRKLNADLLGDGPMRADRVKTPGQTPRG